MWITKDPPNHQLSGPISDFIKHQIAILLLQLCMFICSTIRVSANASTKSVLLKYCVIVYKYCRIEHNCTMDVVSTCLLSELTAQMSYRTHTEVLSICVHVVNLKKKWLRILYLSAFRIAPFSPLDC